MPREYGGRRPSEPTTIKLFDRQYSLPNAPQIYTKDSVFTIACELAGVIPTKRQLSKFRNQHGAAYAERNRAQLELNKRNAARRAEEKQSDA